jgi:cysteine desulfurase
MAFDVARVRGLVPALGDGWIHLAPGMQAPEQVVSAITTALRIPRALPGGLFPASAHAAAVEDAARRAISDLVGADPRGVVLGPGPAVLLQRLADAAGETWMLGDEIVVSRLDDIANVTPWVRNAHRRGAAVRWAEIDIETCELPLWQFDELLGRTTRVVALTGASAQVGVRPEVAAIAERTRESGALLVVDLSAAAPFGPLDLDALGADVVALDAAAWGGPEIGALVFRAPALLDRLASCSLDPMARGPHRLEVGPHPVPQLAGLVASVDPSGRAARRWGGHRLGYPSRAGPHLDGRRRGPPRRTARGAARRPSRYRDHRAREPGAPGTDVVAHAPGQGARRRRPPRPSRDLRPRRPR